MLKERSNKIPVTVHLKGVIDEQQDASENRQFWTLLNSAGFKMINEIAIEAGENIIPKLKTFCVF